MHAYLFVFRYNIELNRHIKLYYTTNVHIVAVFCVGKEHLLFIYSFIQVSHSSRRVSNSEIYFLITQANHVVGTRKNPFIFEKSALNIDV